MANLIPEHLGRGRRLGLVIAAGMAAIMLLSGASSTGPDKSPKCKIDVDSGPTEVDYQTHLLNMRGGVKITVAARRPEDFAACDVSVSADSAQATGLDFNNSKWLFTGKVYVRTQSQGQLHSDRASVEFSNNLLARAIVTGSPAQFEQAPTAAGTPAKGHASTIDYDVVAGTVKLTGDAWLARGDSKMEAPSITYNVRDKEVEGQNGAVPGSRVHMTIVPKSNSGSAPAGTDKP